EHTSARGGHAAAERFDVDDPSHSRFDLVREGVRRDGMEIVHYAPKFPPGRKSKVEKRIERLIALLFTLSGLFGIGFVVAYIWWPFRYEPGAVASKGYPPVLGLTLGGSLLFIALAIIVWAKKLLPDEIVVQDRHPGPSPRDEQQLTGAAILNSIDETGIKRRTLLTVGILAPAVGLGVAAIAPLGALIKNPNDGKSLLKTGWSPLNN